MNTVRAERKKEHRRVAIALAAALLIHVLIIGVVMLLLALKPASSRKPVAPKPEPPPIKLTIIPPPPPRPKPPAAPTPQPKEFIDSAQGQLSEKAPEQATFESDRNTVAGSELPAVGSDPVPTLNGPSTSPGLTLQAQNLSLGPNRQPAPASPASPPRQAAPPVKEQPKEQTKAKPNEEKEPERVAKASPTPKPRPTPRPEDTELALLDPSRPKPQPPKPEEEVRKPEKPTKPSTPSTPGFQPERSVTRLTGGISTKGRASVNAVATPLGRYQKMISDAIGSRWYYYVTDVMELVNVGTVRLKFIIRADGRVEGVSVVSNSSNQTLASCSIRSVVEAEIPPIPKEVAQTLSGNRIELEFSFTIGGR